MPASLTQARLLHLIALLCVGAVVIALISQHAFDMRPCAWCVFQRLIYLVIALLCWLILGLQGRLPTLFQTGVLLLPLLSLGGAIAAWYQYDVAAELFSCALTFADRVMVQSGLDGALPWLFGIQASCMDARVSLFGVEYAIWSLMLFLALTLLSIIALTRGRAAPD